MQVIPSISTRGFCQLQIFISLSPVPHSAQVKTNPLILSKWHSAVSAIPV